MGTLGCDVKGEGVDNLGEGTTPLSTHPLTPEVEGGYALNASVRVPPSWCLLFPPILFFSFLSPDVHILLCAHFHPGRLALLQNWSVFDII
jgi:hypothetical protein